MRVLAITNVSNIDDLACDSGMIFQRILAPQFQELGIDYHILTPKLPGMKSLEIFGSPLHQAALGVNRYSSRFAFDYDGLVSLLHRQPVDVIFNNQIELTGALKGLLIANGHHETRLVSYCHYPGIWPSSTPVPRIDESLNQGGLGLSIILNILAGISISDVAIVQSRFARDMLLHAGEHFRISIRDKLAVVPPPVDPEIVCCNPFSQRQQQVLYNHRLYASYGTEDLIQFVTAIAKDVPFRFAVSDPMAKRSPFRSSINATPERFRDRIRSLPYAVLIDGGGNRYAYAQALSTSRLALAPWRQGCVWSMAAVDCLANGLPVVAPRIAAYSEFIPQPLLFESPQEGRNLVQHLLSNESCWKRYSELSLRAVENLAPKHIAQRLTEYFKGSISCVE